MKVLVDLPKEKRRSTGFLLENCINYKKVATSASLSRMAYCPLQFED